MNGSASKRSCAPTALASVISSRWPSSPNPVTSVTPLRPWLKATWPAAAFSVLIQVIASRSSSSLTSSRLWAVVVTPKPSGLVRNRWSPTRRPPFESSRPVSAIPKTASPNFGSSSLMVCPPPITTPASRHFSAAPRKISRVISRGRFAGNAATLKAKNGCPPMAYTSERLLAAAIAP